MAIKSEQRKNSVQTSRMYILMMVKLDIDWGDRDALQFSHILVNVTSFFQYTHSRFPDVGIPQILSKLQYNCAYLEQ